MTRRGGPRAALAALALLAWLPVVATAEPFPQPPELDADVDFWVSIFTRYDSDEGVLHDNRHLGVVYERIELPQNLSRRDRQQRIASRRRALADILKTLGRGKRDNLGAEEARVLALWPEGVDDATLTAAAGRIRFQQGLADRFRAGLVRSGRWRSFIDREFTALGVPTELAALPHVESSYNPEARSHVGASGIWQFTRSTGRRYMRVDHVLDERNDPFTATRAAGRLLADNYSITGSWPMAITAYNHGLAGVRRAMRQYGDDALVDILRKYKGRTFGFASRNFYVAFLAAMRVDKDPENYFPGVTREAALRYDESNLSAYIPLNDLSRALGVSKDELAKHNPSLQPTVLTGSKHLPKGFGLRLPEGRLSDSLSALLAGVPAEQWTDRQLPDLFHTVARGDTLSEIADAYGTRVSTLVQLNGLNSRHRIRAGQRLRLPAAGPAPPPAAVAAVVEADEAVPDASSAVVEEMTPATMASEPPPEEAVELRTALLSDPSDYSVGDDGTIEVQSLETLGHFADWLGIRTQRLRDINGFAFRTPVVVGQRIKLDFGTVTAAAFEALRIDYHRRQQDSFFRDHVITDVVEHRIRRGESIWILSLRTYDVPIWLFRQYNPTLDLHNVQAGMVVRFPALVAADRS